MDRRKFLIGLGIALIAGPAAVSLKGCGGSSSSDNAAAPANSFSVTSNPDNTGHSHNVIIPLADLATPSGGKTYTSDGSHQHQITLTQQQLTDISNGVTVPVTSIPDTTGHSHVWTIKKPA